VRTLLQTDAELTSVGVAQVLDHLVRVVGAEVPSSLWCK